MEEQQNSFKDSFLAAVLDQMDTNFYITDVETDEILYMNKTMKETFGLARPEGCICWQDRKSTRLNSSHITRSRMPSSA